MGEGIEHVPSTRATFRAAFPVYEAFDWEMPSDDDTNFVEKLEQMPLWGNKFREDDIDTILTTLHRIGFDVSAVAETLYGLYEEASKPRVQKDTINNEPAQKWQKLITSLLHIVTTELCREKPETLRTPGTISGSVLTMEERSQPLEKRHLLQNNIAIEILSDDKLSDLAPQAKGLTRLFGSKDTAEEQRERLEKKLNLEKAYFQKRYPNFFIK